MPGCAVISTGAAWANVAASLSKDLGRSATDIGLAAGIVFLGHIVVPIPGNLIQYRIGARHMDHRHPCRLVASHGRDRGCGQRRDPLSRADPARLRRRGIGAEIRLYLTSWLPRSQHSRALSYFFLVVHISAIVGALVASFLLSHDGLMLGLVGWRSVFLTEGSLSLLLAALVWFALARSPQDASWLTGPELMMLKAELGRDTAPAQAAALTSARARSGTGASGRWPSPTSRSASGSRRWRSSCRR